MSDREHEVGEGAGERGSPTEVEHRLSRLRAATDRIPVPAGLSARVLGAVKARREPDLAEVILLSGRRALALAAIAAAAAAALGVQMERSLASAAAESALFEDLADDLEEIEP